MADFPIKVIRKVEDKDGCELRAEDHRGELYRVEFENRDGLVLQVTLCRHHTRALRNVLVEV